MATTMLSGGGLPFQQCDRGNICTPADAAIVVMSLQMQWCWMTTTMDMMGGAVSDVS
jgi:hypothetical protein